MEFLGIVIGAFLAGGIGIFTVYCTKRSEEKSTKLYMSKALLVEVKENQNQLRSSENYKQDYKNEIEKSSSITMDRIMETIQHLNSISFDRTIYSPLSDKIGLLYPKSGEEVVQYYAKIKLLENKLKLFREISLISSKNDYQPALMRLSKTTPNTKSELCEFFTNAEEAYNIGEGLIKSLNVSSNSNH